MKVEIANRLYEYRKASGMSQEQVASLLGVSRQAVSKWECAESSPDTDNLIALAQLYGVSIDELLFADPETGTDTLAVAEHVAEEPSGAEDTVEEAVEEEPAPSYTPPTGNDYVDISLERGVHVRDTKKGEEVHVGWDGIHIDSGDEHVHIDFNNFKDIAQAFRQIRKSR